MTEFCHARRRLFGSAARLGGVLTAATLLGTSPTLAHDPGQLDRSFSGDGVRYVDFGRFETATALFTDAEARLVLAGISIEFPGFEPRVASTRLEPDGRALDRSFGDRGRALVDPTPRSDPALAWASAPDGGRIVLGGFNGPSNDYYLMRFRPDGSVDRSFGEDGVVIRRVGSDFVLPTDVLVQPRGRILVLLTVDDGTLVKAHRADGAAARGFGIDGRVPIAGNGGEVLLRQPDGRILVVGQTGRERVIIDALHGNGELDEAFSGDGRATLRIEHRSDEFLVEQASVLTDGSIAVAGEVGFFESDTFVARFTSGGSRDVTFGGGDGWRRFDIGDIDVPGAIVDLPGARLVIVGSVQPDRVGDDRSGQIYVVGVRADGRYWRRFGDEGVVREDFGNRLTLAQSARIVGGKLVVVGVSRTDMFAARYFLHPE